MSTGYSDSPEIVSPLLSKLYGMVEYKVTGVTQLDRLYKQAKKSVRYDVSDSPNLYASNSYIRWKQKVHTEFYRLIKAAGIEIEGI
jgi:hypothetical protein